MTAFWLTYRPESHIGGQPCKVKRLAAAEKPVNALWRFSGSESAEVGNTVYLFKLGKVPKGIFGVGVIAETIKECCDSEDAKKPSKIPRAVINFTHFVNPQEKLLVDFNQLTSINGFNNFESGASKSGTKIPPDIATEIENLL